MGRNSLGRNPNIMSFYNTEPPWTHTNTYNNTQLDPLTVPEARRNAATTKRDRDDDETRTRREYTKLYGAKTPAEDLRRPTSMSLSLSQVRGQ